MMSGTATLSDHTLSGQLLICQSLILLMLWYAFWAIFIIMLPCHNPCYWYPGRPITKLWLSPKPYRHTKPIWLWLSQVNFISRQLLFKWGDNSITSHSDNGTFLADCQSLVIYQYTSDLLSALCHSSSHRKSSSDQLEINNDQFFPHITFVIV